MIERPPTLLDVVALLVERPEHGLDRGQVGTVVEALDDNTVLVEFGDEDGESYAILAVPVSELLVLRHEPEVA